MKKRIMAIFLLIILLVGCSQKTKNKEIIDLTSNIKIEYNGVNGKGIAFEPKLNSSINYDKTNVDIANFLENVKYSVAPNKDLYNGQKIKITATYDKEVAKSLDLNIINSNSEVEVSGLATFVQKADDISKEFLEDFIKSTDKKANKSTNYGNVELDSVYFGKGDQGKMIMFSLYGFTYGRDNTTLIIYCQEPSLDNEQNNFFEISTNRYDFFGEERKLSVFKDNVEKNINKKFSDDYYRLSKVR